jgi:hypothetical protein
MITAPTHNVSLRGVIPAAPVATPPTQDYHSASTPTGRTTKHLFISPLFIIAVLSKKMKR